jgi:hypothetical protein
MTCPGFVEQMHFTLICIVIQRVCTKLFLEWKSKEGSGGIAQIFLTSALDGGDWPASRHDCFTSREVVSGTHWIGGWLGLRVDLDAVEKREIFPLPRMERRPSSLSLYRLSYPYSCKGNMTIYEAGPYFIQEYVYISDIKTFNWFWHLRTTWSF